MLLELEQVAGTETLTVCRLLQLGAMTGVNRIGILTGLLAPSLISGKGAVP